MYFPLRVEESKIAPGWFDIFLEGKLKGSRRDVDEPIASSTSLLYACLLVKVANACIKLNPDNPLETLERLEGKE